MGIELDKVEVRFEDLRVKAYAESAGRTLPSIWNSYRNAAEVRPQGQALGYSVICGGYRGQGRGRDRVGPGFQCLEASSRALRIYEPTRVNAESEPRVL